MDHLKMYCINQDYIDYLRSFDSKVLYNKDESRPYIGILMTINDLSYFAPLSSPKQKHKSMKNMLDIYKIEKGNLGIINFNNMLPVNMDDVVEIDFNSKDEKYKTLLIKQIQAINADYEVVFKKANKLYGLHCKDAIPIISRRCCDFKLLEMKCLKYIVR